MSRYFKTQPGPVAKNATLGHPAGNRTRDLTNLVQCSANSVCSPKGAFFVTGPGWVLKYLDTRDFSPSELST